ncbi:limbic system-associated membrane protein-like [Hetaerina americana]|uniref:limbic system-associated membrane protein-like n=1 Tax=Hetaerina americana TaxID=62018 RepID=UPI003A7F51F2
MAHPRQHTVNPLIPLLLVHCLAAPVCAPADFSPASSERPLGISAVTAAESTAEEEEGATGGFEAGVLADGPTERPSVVPEHADGTGHLGMPSELPRILPGPVNLSDHVDGPESAGPKIPPPALHVLPPHRQMGEVAPSASSGATSITEPPTTVVATQRTPLPGSVSPTTTHPWLPPVHHPVHHHGPKSRFGPYFEEGADGSNVTARLGSTVRMDCKIGMLQDKTVTWLHRKDDAIHLLTVGRQTYSSDSRFSLAYRYPNNWRLQILFTNRRDEGLYECQVATHPIRVRKVYLKVTAPQIRIVDENRHDVHERYYKVGSEVELTCLATQLEERDGLPEVDEGNTSQKDTTTSPAPPSPPRRSFSVLRGAAGRVLWRQGDSAITHNSNGRGVGIRVSAGGRNVALTLRIESVTKEDGGNYTCSIGTISSATVFIHILNGELPAAVQYGTSANLFEEISIWLQIICLYLSCGVIWR